MHLVFRQLGLYQCQKPNERDLFEIQSSLDFGHLLYSLSRVCIYQVIDFVNAQYETYLDGEARVNRRPIPDTRVHACLYFIAPSGHGLKVSFVLNGFYILLFPIQVLLNR